MIGILLAIASSLCWAGLDATRKRLSDVVEPVTLVFLLTAGQLPIFGAWILLLPDTRLEIGGYSLPGIGCVLLNLVANVSFVKAVQISPLGKTVPFLSFTPAFTAVSGWLILGEALALPQIGGILLVVGGAMILGVRRGGDFRVERGSLLMVGVAACWSVTGALDKIALRHASVSVHAGVQAAGIAVVLGLVVLATSRRRHLDDLKKGLLPYGLAVLFAAGASALQFFAVQMILLSMVETIKRAVGATMSVVVGRLGFEEPITIGKVVAILAMSAGTALLLLG